MSITKETVLKVANLNRLAIDDTQAEKWVPELNKIMGFIEQLSEVDTDGVEPLANVVDIPLRLREDEVSDGNCQDKVLANAPESMQGFYVVPKVVE
ncbi:MAG: Asp-tRNA(Asn)/Glu-tRNA(Gln) amidotransferase subunit GatC [Alphaproteobacteria bacterium]